MPTGSITYRYAFSVGELLINKGVDEKCFRIDPDEEWSIPLADRKYGTEDKQRIVSDLIAYLESREDGYSMTTVKIEDSTWIRSELWIFLISMIFCSKRPGKGI